MIRSSLGERIPTQSGKQTLRILNLMIVRSMPVISGEVIVMKRDTTSTEDDSTSDIDDIVKRLTCTSDGCEVKLL